jgi:hypothetical protein
MRLAHRHQRSVNDSHRLLGTPTSSMYHSGSVAKGSGSLSNGSGPRYMGDYQRPGCGPRTSTTSLARRRNSATASGMLAHSSQGSYSAGTKATMMDGPRTRSMGATSKGHRLYRIFSACAIALLLLVWAGQAHAQITPTLLTAGGLDGTNAVGTTASVTPASGSLVLLSAWSIKSSSPIPEPAIAGNSLTWALVTSTVESADVKRAWLFCAKATSPSAGTITITYSNNQTDIGWMVVQVTGADVSGTCTDAIVQTKTDHVSTNSMTLTFTSAFSHANNRPIAFTHRVSSAATTSEWTELNDATVTNVVNNHVMWKDASDDTSATMSWVGSTFTAGILAEIKAATTCRNSLLMRRVGGC